MDTKPLAAINPSGLIIGMPTVYRANGLEVMIYVDDHRPAHVHVFSADGEVVINLHDSVERMEIRTVAGMRKKDVRKAWDVVTENHAAFLRQWREIHG